MSAVTKRLVTIAGLTVLAWAGAPIVADAGGARLYEMTENMRLTNDGKLQRRQATSALIGTADAGTPLCPAAVVAMMTGAAKACTVNATGSDDISLATGLGKFGGTFTVVVQGDNSADAPELVVMRGSFKGKMDFSPAILHTVPLGFVTGTLQVAGGSDDNRNDDNNGSRGASFPFTGTFRLPFVMSGLKVDGSGICTPSLTDAACWPMNDSGFFTTFYGAVPPLPLAQMERYDLSKMTRPFYLLDTGDMQPVQSSEFGAGWAAVKFEINF
jgi:hypothetical protein